jgi:serine/threonine-protein kinase HipA
MHLKNWSLLYPDGRTPRLSPAYDFVATIAYLKDDKLALSFVDSKAYESLTRDQFARFAAKSGLPRKLTLDTVEDTVSMFAKEWHGADVDALDDAVRGAIDSHLSSIPLWAEIAGGS